MGYVLPVAIGKKGNEFVFNTKPGLHYWHTPDNAENALVRGSDEDQQLAVKDLYALLLHTTSTHAPRNSARCPGARAITVRATSCRTERLRGRSSN